LPLWHCDWDLGDLASQKLSKILLQILEKLGLQILKSRRDFHDISNSQRWKTGEKETRSLVGSRAKISKCQRTDPDIRNSLKETASSKLEKHTEISLQCVKKQPDLLTDELIRYSSEKLTQYQTLSPSLYMYLVVPLSLSLFLSSVYVTWQAWTAYASTNLEKTYPRLTQIGNENIRNHFTSLIPHPNLWSPEPSPDRVLLELFCVNLFKST